MDSDLDLDQPSPADDVVADEEVLLDEGDAVDAGQVIVRQSSSSSSSTTNGNTTKPSSVSVLPLPPEVMAMIFEFVDLEDLYFLRLASREINGLAYDALLRAIGYLVIEENRGAAFVDFVNNVRDSAFDRAGSSLAAAHPPLQCESIGLLLRAAGVSRGSIGVLEVVSTLNYEQLGDLGLVLKGLHCDASKIRSILDNVDRADWSCSETADILRNSGLAVPDAVYVIADLDNVTPGFRWGVVADLEKWWDGFDEQSGPDHPGNAVARAGLLRMLEDPDSGFTEDESRRCEEIGELLREWDHNAVWTLLPICSFSWLHKGRLVAATLGWGEDYMRGVFGALARFFNHTGGPTDLSMYAPPSVADRRDFFIGLSGRYGGLQFTCRGFFVDTFWPPGAELQLSDFVADPRSLFRPSALAGLLHESRPVDVQRLVAFLKSLPKHEELITSACTIRQRGDRTDRLADLLGQFALPTRSLAKIMYLREHHLGMAQPPENFGWHPSGSQVSVRQVGALLAWCFVEHLQPQRTANKAGDLLRRTAAIRDSSLSKRSLNMEVYDELATGFIDELFQAKRSVGRHKALAFLGMLASPVSQPAGTRGTTGRRHEFTSSQLFQLLAKPDSELFERIETRGDVRSVLVGLAIGAGQLDALETDRLSAWRLVVCGIQHQVPTSSPFDSTQEKLEFLKQADKMEVAKGKQAVQSAADRWQDDEDGSAVHEAMVKVIVAKTRVSRNRAEEILAVSLSGCDCKGLELGLTCAFVGWKQKYQGDVLLAVSDIMSSTSPYGSFYY